MLGSWLSEVGTLNSHENSWTVFHELATAGAWVSKQRWSTEIQPSSQPPGHKRARTAAPLPSPAWPSVLVDPAWEQIAPRRSVARLRCMHTRGSRGRARGGSRPASRQPDTGAARAPGPGSSPPRGWLACNGQARSPAARPLRLPGATALFISWQTHGSCPLA